MTEAEAKAGASLARGGRYGQLVDALGELEWQAEVRVTDDRPIDTGAPGALDPTAKDQTRLDTLDSVNSANRGTVRAQVEAMIRRQGIAGTRREIAHQREMHNAPGAGQGAGAEPARPDPTIYHEFDEELAAFERLYTDLPGRFAAAAKTNALSMLKSNEEGIKQELARYGIVSKADHVIGPFAY